MKELTLYVYKVGHGVFTLLHGTQDDDSPFNAVFDCGFQPFCCGAQYNNGIALDINYLRANAIEHAAQIILQDGANDRLDYLVCSHQDQDHHNLIPELLGRLNCLEGRLTNTDWFLTSAEKIVNGVERASKTIYQDPSNEQNLIYEFSDTCEDSTDLKITQYVIYGAIESDMYITELHGSAVCRDFIDGDDFETDISVSLELYLDARVFQDSGRTNNQVVGITFKFIASFNQAPFEYEWTQGEGEFFNLSGWYDMLLIAVRLSLSEKFADEMSEVLGESLEDILNDIFKWLNMLGVNCFKKSDALYDGVTLAKIYNKTDSYPSLLFNIGKVIMGGLSGTNEYDKLCKFLYKYQNVISSQGVFFRNEAYTFVNMNSTMITESVAPAPERVADSAEEDAEEEETVEDDEESQKYIFNETSTVVNFTYTNVDRRNYSVLFPGDITVHHLVDVSERVRASGAKCVYIIAPHHGSLKTNFIFGEDGLIEMEEQPLNTMYAALAPVKTFISECFNNTLYYTPTIEFFTVANNFAPDIRVDHIIPVFDEDEDGIQRIDKSTVCGVYLTGMFSDFFYYEMLIGGNELAAPFVSEPADKPARVLPPDELFV